ncbi:MAG: hypothetical protein QMD36_00775 [Candidatus Aenigmarchaeota archaeon]|nr:hypothetical protein [Candidatus Aenigmarchaeota archaeon]
MKGVSKFISYAITILFGFTILIFLSTLIYNYYDEIIQNTIKAELKQICIQTANSIIQLHNLAKEFDAYPETNSSIIISSIDLDYPNKVGGKNFEVELLSSPGIWNLVTNITIEGKNVTIVKETSSSSKIVAKTTQKPIVVYEYDIPNIPIVLQGKFRSGESDTLRLVRYNYNEDRIILGESEIIVGITSIS